MRSGRGGFVWVEGERVGMCVVIVVVVCEWGWVRDIEGVGKVLGKE